LTRAALAKDEAEVRRIDATLQPLWALFKQHGSLRVVYAAANLLGLTQAQPPRPILPLGAVERERIREALGQVSDGTRDPENASAVTVRRALSDVALSE